MRAGPAVTGDNQQVSTIPRMRVAPIAWPREEPRYALLAILVLELFGGIVAAKLLGGEHAYRVAPAAR